MPWGYKLVNVPLPVFKHMPMEWVVCCLCKELYFNQYLYAIPFLPRPPLPPLILTQSCVSTAHIGLLLY